MALRLLIHSGKSIPPSVQTRSELTFSVQLVHKNPQWFLLAAVKRCYASVTLPLPSVIEHEIVKITLVAYVLERLVTLDASFFA